MTDCRPCLPRVATLWEDTYCDKLDLLLKRCMKRLQGPPVAIEPFPAHGNSKFDGYVLKNWPNARRLGLTRSGPIDFLICIADADRATACCDSILPPPLPEDAKEQLDQWIEDANAKWTEKLRTSAHIDPVSMCD
jgi:hypothetical protein